MKKNNKKILLIGLLAVGVLAVSSFMTRTTLMSTDPDNTQFQIPTGPNAVQGVPFLAPDQEKDPAIAGQYGVHGYIEIDRATGASSSLTINGSQAGIIFLITFVSFDSANYGEAQVTLDPSSGNGLSIQQAYNGGTLDVNSLLVYNVSKLTIKANETIPVELTIQKPTNIGYSINFPVDAVGITADFPIIDNTGVTVYG